MITLLALLAVPLVIALATMLFFKGKVTLWEFGAQCAVVFVILGIGLLICYNGSTGDTETLNGFVTQKTKDQVGCRHSYDCNCYTTCSGSGANRSCSQHCSTCYEHSYDIDWNIHTTLGSIGVDTVDRQGLVMPPRWGIAYVNEPVAKPNSYTNYLLASPDSILRPSYLNADAYQKFIPPYPQVYDYYHIQRFINMGVPNASDKDWQWLLDKLNAELGSAKQVNVIMILLPTDDPKAAMAIQDRWLGGKKNDAVIVIGTKAYPKIDFVQVMSWSPNQIYKVELRDAILEIGDLGNRDMVMQVIRDTTNRKFVRMHMKDYEYLTRSYQPTRTETWVLFILGTLASIGLSVWTVLNEFTDDNPTGDRPRYRYSGY